jgi:hypothetical protein
MEHDVNEGYCLELVRRIITEGDQEARAELQQRWNEILLGWLRRHPGRGVACRWESEEYYIAMAFERFWQAAVEGQVTCQALAEVLAYLRASLNGIILETLRTNSRPGESARPTPGEPGKPDVDDNADASEIWARLQAKLADQREQRLAYLLYHCGLGPREIVRFYPQEWSDVQEIHSLRRAILERLLSNANQLALEA